MMLNNIQTMPSRRIAIKRLLEAQWLIYRRNARSVLWTAALPILILGLARASAGSHPTHQILWLGAALALNTGIYALGLFGYAMQLGQNREKGIFRRLRCTPTYPGWFLASEGIVQLGSVLIQAVLVIGVVALGFRASFEGIQIGWAALSIVLSGFVSLTIGQALVAFVLDLRSLTALSRFLLFTLLFVQGIFLKVTAWPKILQHVARWTPVDLTLRLLDHAILFDTWTRTQDHELLALAAYAVILGMAGLVFFRWDPNRTIKRRKA